MKHTPASELPKDKAYLHFEAARIHEAEVQVDYELVIPLNQTDCRGTWDHKGRAERPTSHRIVWLDKQNNKRIPLGRTMVGTDNANYPLDKWKGERLDLPFRDSAHCLWDNERLGGLPVYYTMSGKHWLLEKETEEGTATVLKVNH